MSALVFVLMASVTDPTLPCAVPSSAASLVCCLVIQAEVDNMLC